MRNKTLETARAARRRPPRLDRDSRYACWALGRDAAARVTQLAAVAGQRGLPAPARAVNPFDPGSPEAREWARGAAGLDFEHDTYRHDGARFPGPFLSHWIE